MKKILIFLIACMPLMTYGQIFNNGEYIRIKDSVTLGNTVNHFMPDTLANLEFVRGITPDSALYAYESDSAKHADTSDFARNVENALGNFTVADTLGVGVVSGEAGGGFEWVVVEEFPCNSLSEFAESQSATVSGGVLTVNTEGGVDLINASNTPEKMAMITANDSVRVYFNIVSCGTGFGFGYNDGSFQNIDVSTCSTGVYVRNFRIGASDPILISISGDVVQIDSIAIEVYKETTPTITLLHDAYIGSVADSNKLITQAELDVATVDSARAASTAEGSQGNFTANGDVTADNLTSLGNITATWNIEGDNIKALTAVQTPELRMNGDTAVGIAGSSELDVLFKSAKGSDTVNSIQGYIPNIKLHRIDTITPTSADVWTTVVFDTLIAEESLSGYTYTDSIITTDFKGISFVGGCLDPLWTATAGSGSVRVRITVNGEEIRCARAQFTRTNQTSDTESVGYRGIIAHEIGDEIKLQYKVSSTNFIFAGDDGFDKPTAATIFMHKTSDLW